MTLFNFPFSDDAKSTRYRRGSYAPAAWRRLTEERLWRGIGEENGGCDERWNAENGGVGEKSRWKSDPKVGLFRAPRKSSARNFPGSVTRVTVVTCYLHRHSNFRFSLENLQPPTKYVGQIYFATIPLWYCWRTVADSAWKILFF